MRLESFYQNIEIFPDKRLILFEWKPSTELMTQDEFINELKLITQTLDEHKGKMEKALILTQNLKFLLTPSNQKTLNNILAPAYQKSGIKKIAIVLPKDDIQQISVEDAIEDGKEVTKVETRLFTDEIHARSWLKV